MTAQDSTSLCREALALHGQGKVVQAAALLEQALRIDPESVQAALLLVPLLRHQGRSNEALALLDRLTRAHPDEAAPWRMLGFFHWKAGRLAEALAPLQRHADLLPADATAQLDLARLHLELGDWESALRSVRLVGAEDAAAAEARFLEGQALFESGDSESAMRAYLDAARQRPELGQSGGGRLLEAWIANFRSWAEAGGGEYRVVAPGELGLIPAPQVIPASEQTAWPARRIRWPEVFVGKLDGAEVIGREFPVLSSDACLFVEGFVTTPSVFPRKGGTVKYVSSDARVLLDLPREAIEHDGPCVLLGRSNNHFHFLLESLPRIHSLELYGMPGDVPALVPEDLYPTSLEILAMFGFPEERLVRVPTDGSVHCGTLYAPSLLGYGLLPSPIAVRFVRERLLSKAPPWDDMPRRVYLSRNRMPRRHVRNEDELLPLLERHGFRTVYPERLGVAAQIRMFASAEAIVSPDSSALANLAFAAPSAKVGVFSWRGIHLPIWHAIAFLVGAQLTYIHADAVIDSHARLEHRDMNVEPALLEQWLDAL